MNVFKLNDHLMLKLENGFTNIYVNGQYFEQCKFLLLNIPKESIRKFDYIESIDEAAEILDRSMEGNEFFDLKITPEAEFWGHCSNLQVWIENNYDTRLLHSNLAFPLLKKLSYAGDPKAHRVFKEEIAKRLLSGYPSVVAFLQEEGYLEEFNEEERKNIADQIADKLLLIDDFHEFCDEFILFFNIGYKLLISVVSETLGDKILKNNLNESDNMNLQRVLNTLNDKEIEEMFVRVKFKILALDRLKSRLFYLKIFSEYGIKQARRGLRDELIKVLLGNNEDLIRFLITDRYFDALSRSDMVMLIDFPDCSTVFLEYLSKRLSQKFQKST